MMKDVKYASVKCEGYGSRGRICKRTAQEWPFWGFGKFGFPMQSPYNLRDFNPENVESLCIWSRDILYNM